MSMIGMASQEIAASAPDTIWIDRRMELLMELGSLPSVSLGQSGSGCLGHTRRPDDGQAQNRITGMARSFDGHFRIAKKDGEPTGSDKLRQLAIFG
jgi:hypothetical protein